MATINGHLKNKLIKTLNKFDGKSFTFFFQSNPDSRLYMLKYYLKNWWSP